MTMPTIQKRGVKAFDLVTIRIRTQDEPVQRMPEDPDLLDFRSEPPDREFVPGGTTAGI
jgi:hypothetical protein